MAAGPRSSASPSRRFLESAPSAQSPFPGGDIPRGRVPMAPDGDTSRVRGRPSCPQAHGLCPSMSNVPSGESLRPTPRTSGAARPARAGQERADRVQIGDKGSERTHTDEGKPHDSAVCLDGRGVPAVLCHRFGHSGPRSPPMRCQCALPSSTRSTPAMMSTMPATMVRVSGSPKRSLEAIAVTATPPADQIP